MLTPRSPVWEVISAIITTTESRAAQHSMMQRSRSQVYYKQNHLCLLYSALQLGYITLLELACPLSDHDEVRDCYNYDP